MGTSFFILFFLVFILVFFNFSDFLTKRYPFLLCKTKINRFFANTMLNFFSRIILESYLSFSLMCLIQLQSKNDNLLGELFGLILSGLILTILVAFPLFILLLSLRYKNKLKQKRFRNIGTLFENLKVEKSITRNFNFVFCIRRGLLAFALVFCQKNFFFQVQLTLCISLF